MIYYVYILMYPDRTPFYVGKGCGNRMYAHAAEARSAHQCRKCRAIREIWASGHDITYTIALETENEREAYRREMQLIGQLGKILTNVRCVGGPVGERYIPDPTNPRWMRTRLAHDGLTEEQIEREMYAHHRRKFDELMAQREYEYRRATPARRQEIDEQVTALAAILYPEMVKESQCKLWADPD